VPLEADPVFRTTPFLSAAKPELQEPAGPAKLLECLAVLSMVERPEQVDKRLAVPIVERSRRGRLDPRSHWPSFFPFFPELLYCVSGRTPCSFSATGVQGHATL
jgi:hypothetical protein